MPLTTEAINSQSEKIDQMSSLEMVRMMNAEDAKLVAAVNACSSAIAKAIDLIADRIGDGGRLIYMGAGTSGRLGVLDASECPPTFNTDPGLVIGLIAGGDIALRNAVEGAEDSKQAGAECLQDLNLKRQDVVVGIAASGATPFVIGGLEYAGDHGAKTIALVCNADSPIGKLAEVEIAVIVGPEVLAGSTRLKAGSATKMVLNMLSTGAMIRLGKTYGNLMVDLRASNRKLKRRSICIVATATGLPEAEVEDLLRECGGEVKTAIARQKLGLPVQEIRALLDEHGGRLSLLLSDAK